MVPTLKQEIRKGQLEDAKIKEIKQLMKEGKAPDYRLDEQGTLLARKVNLCAGLEDS